MSDIEPPAKRARLASATDSEEEAFIAVLLIDRSITSGYLYTKPRVTNKLKEWLKFILGIKGKDRKESFIKNPL